MAVISLNAVGPRDRSEVGGKALNLARLWRHRLPVPPAVVVPTKVFRQFLKRNGLLDLAVRTDLTAHDAKELRESIRAGSLSKETEDGLVLAGRDLGSCLAVRSSGVDEDASEQSHAGLFSTFLGVQPGEDLEQALKGCWASGFSEHVLAYSKQGNDPLGIAVVIQKMVQPRCAGVMFTINPLNGSWREMAVEAAWGLGESVVGGHVVPDYYRVQRPRRAPRPVQRVLARVNLSVLEDEVRPQEHMLFLGETGKTEEGAVPVARVGAPKLRHDDLFRLCRLGLRVEGLFGEPQDIEWALDEQGRFCLLQARPVTTAKAVRRSGSVVWTRRFGGERWTEPATPLGWSEARALLEHFIAYPDTSRRLLGGEEATRLFRCSPYFNVSVFRHLAFKFPGAPPPRFMVELLPPIEEQGWLRRHAQAPDLRVYASIIGETLRGRRWRRFRWNPLSNWKAWDAFAGELDAKLASLDTPFTTVEDAQTRLVAYRELAKEYVKIHICSLLFANIWFQITLATLNGRGFADQASTVLVPMAMSETVRMNQALWRLARGEMDLEAFLDDYGHRSASSWELFSERWMERPQQVRALANGALGQPDPGEMVNEGLQEADSVEKSVPLSARWMVRLTRRYLLLREDQRFQFDRILWQWKRSYVFLEEQVGLELRFLRVAEVDALLAGRMERELADANIARRKATYLEECERRRSGDEPPVFVDGDAQHGLTDQRQRLQGLGISMGVVTGPVRILRTLDEAPRLQDGEILVTLSTDPGWTPLFFKASGLIMELGGMLSHGAVVAREFKLPAVVNVIGATSRLRDGQVVTLDGGRGVVWLR